jgi:hypothetical protein
VFFIHTIPSNTLPICVFHFSATIAHLTVGWRFPSLQALSKIVAATVVFEHRGCPLDVGLMARYVMGTVYFNIQVFLSTYLLKMSSFV